MVITIALMVFLLSRTSFDDIIVTLKGIKPIYLAFGFFLYICSYILKTTRYTILLNKKINFREMFTIVCFHNAAINIMPARAGELSFIYLVKKWHRIPIADGTASLIVTRFLDYIAISLLFLLSLGIERMPGIKIWIVWAILAFMGVLFSMVFLMVFYKNFITYPRTILKRIGIEKNHAALYLLEKTESLIKSMQSMNSNYTILLSFLMSILIWLIIIFMYWMLGTGMNLTLNFMEMTIATTFFLLTTILPISGIGGFGTSESGWVIGLVLMGIPLKFSINMGFSLHIIILIFSIILGMVSVKKLSRGFSSNNNLI